MTSTLKCRAPDAAQVYVEDPGESTFLIGEIISKNEFNKQNQKLLEEGRAPARSKPILKGSPRRL